ncbi:MAG TPA: hypothetical protein VGI23_15210 [Steroidobacteraceae bacterium]
MGFRWWICGLLFAATTLNYIDRQVLFTLPSDLFPQRAVASVVGLGGLGGAVSGMCFPTLTGLLLQTTGS